MQNATPDAVRILLIEDNEDDYVLLEAFLPPSEFTITWTANARTAREMLTQARFDIILMDHGLPDANALSLLEDIRSRHPQLPVIVLTGHDDQAVAISAIKLGAASYILKDEISEHLLPAIREVVGNVDAPRMETAVPPDVKVRFVDTAERVYRALIESMNEGCFLISANGIITFVNKALGNLIGHNSAHLLGRSGLHIFTPETRTKLQRILTKAAAARVTHTSTVEGSMQREDGEEAAVLLSVTHMYADNGKYDASMVILTDVTDLVQTRRELDALYQKEHAYNRKLQTLHKISAAVSDLNSDRLVAHTCELIGREFDYYKVSIGLVHGDTIRIEQKHKYEQRKTQEFLQDSGVVSRLEKSVMATAVNEERIIYVPDLQHSAHYALDPRSRSRSELAVPILAQAGCIGVLDVQSDQPYALEENDILLLRLMADYLANSLQNANLFQTIANERSRLQALIAASYDGIVFFTMNARISIINERAVDFLQLPGTAADWINQSLSSAITVLDQISPAAAKAGMAELTRLRSGSFSSNQGEMSVPPHTLKWFHIPVSVSDDILGWLLVLRDVTAERSADQIRRDLTHAMVHDLRNPLTAISLSLDLISMSDQAEEKSLSSRQRTHLNNTIHMTRKLSHLVNNILDVSRLESGHMPLQRQPIAIAELVTEIVTTQQVLITEKQLSLINDVPAELPPVSGDYEVISRVMQNLMDNAVKFTPAAGQVLVTAQPVANGEAPAALKISIFNSGAGIDQSLQERLFGKFVTGSDERKGSGLGLAFCKLAVEAHRGRIWIESEPNKGTTVSFTLPVAA